MSEYKVSYLDNISKIIFFEFSFDRVRLGITTNGPGHLRRTKVRRTCSKKSGVFLKCLVVRRLLLNPLFRPGPLCKREGLGAFFKAKILRLRSPLYHERIEGGEQLLHNGFRASVESDFTDIFPL